MLQASHTGHRLHCPFRGQSHFQFDAARRVRQVQRAAQSTQRVHDRSDRSQPVRHSLRAALDHREQPVVSLGVQRVRLRDQLIPHVHNWLHEHLSDGYHISGALLRSLQTVEHQKINHQMGSHHHSHLLSQRHALGSVSAHWLVALLT